MAERSPGNRRVAARPAASAAGGRRKSPLAHVVPVLAMLLPVFLVIWRWDEVRDAGWLQNVGAVFLGLAIVVAVIVGVVRSQARARAAAPPGGWGGLAMFQLESFTDSPRLGEHAPRKGALATMLFHRGVTGRLLVAEDVSFQPGPRASLLGARPFSLTRSEVRNLAVKDRFLAIQVRDERSPVLAKVVQKQGLIGAVTRFMKQPSGQGR